MRCKGIIHLKNGTTQTVEFIEDCTTTDEQEICDIAEEHHYDLILELAGLSDDDVIDVSVYPL